MIHISSLIFSEIHYKKKEKKENVKLLFATILLGTLKIKCNKKIDTVINKQAGQDGPVSLI